MQPYPGYGPPAGMPPAQSYRPPMPGMPPGPMGAPGFPPSFPPPGGYTGYPPAGGPPNPYGYRPGFPPAPYNPYLRPSMPTPPARPPAPVLAPASLQKPAEEKSTTVYVGKIAKGVDNKFLQTLLECCGKVSSWKRVADPDSGRLKGFGFCEYESGDGVLRALRLLNNFSLGGNELMLKVDSKTQKYIDEYLERKKDAIKVARSEALKAPKTGGVYKAEAVLSTATDDATLAEELNQAQKDEDTRVIAELAKLAESWRPKDDEPMPVGPQTKIAPQILPLEQFMKPNGEEMTEEEKQKAKVVSNQINAFRERQAQREKEAREKREREYRRQKEEDARKEEREKRDKEREERDEEREKRRERDRENRDKDEEGGDKGDGDDKEKRDRARSSEREHDSRDSRRDHRGSDRDRDRNHKHDRDNKNREPPEESGSSARFDRLRALEKHDQRDRESQRGYRSRSSLEDDERFAREAARRREKAKSRSPSPARGRGRESRRDRRDRSRSRSRDADRDKRDAERLLSTLEPPAAAQVPFAPPPPPPIAPSSSSGAAAAPSSSSGIRLAATKKRTGPVASVFGADDDDDGVAEARKKMKLVPIEYSEEEKRTAEAALRTQTALLAAKEEAEKRKAAKLKKLIDQIPTDTSKLFAFTINWTAFDSAGVADQKIQPWVKKKIMEYLGEEEPTLTQFVVGQIKQHAPPAAIKKELEEVLDSEAEMFVVKLWRYLIFETMRAEVDAT